MLNVFNFAARNVGEKIKYSNISSQDQSSTIKKDKDLARFEIFLKLCATRCGQQIFIIISFISKKIKFLTQAETASIL